jgi:hypothetical protein
VTVGALSFSASRSGVASSSASQSQRPSVRYSQPCPTGGAIDRIESKTPVPASVPIASKDGWSRIRCWVVRVPARSA